MLKAVASGTKTTKAAKDLDISTNTPSTNLGSKESTADALARGMQGIQKDKSSCL